MPKVQFNGKTNFKKTRRGGGKSRNVYKGLMDTYQWVGTDCGRWGDGQGQGEQQGKKWDNCK